MALGYCPALLQSLAEVAKDANPMYKVQPNGFTSMLMRASTPSIIKNDSFNGHKRTVTIKYRPRITVAQTDTTASCDNVLTQPYSEASVSVASYRQSGFHIDDEVLAQYCDDATKMASNGGRPSTLMYQEVLEHIFSHANALLHGVNQDLLNLLVFGRNKVNGTTAAVSINLPKDSNVQPINNGVPKILGDYKKNGLTGRPQIVGQGIMLNYVLSQFAKGIDQSGFDSKIMTGVFDFWNDDDFDAIIGIDEIGVFESNALQIVEYLKYQGYKAGQKPGASEFGIMPLPMLVNNEVVPVWFDWQLKYYDCETTLTDAYTGQSSTYQKGYSMIISKNFGLFQIPSDAYRYEDPMRGYAAVGVNGALNYLIANACDNC